jgi:uncharacterized repeat protein (TIGR03803 family)
MHTRGRFPNVMFGASLRPQTAALAIMLTLLFLIFFLVFISLTAQPAQGQTFQVIHNFTRGVDGANPWAGLTIDAAGNLYGTTYLGGDKGGRGTVFKLSQTGTGWMLSSLYTFHQDTHGTNPEGGVVIGEGGSLYGTTAFGGFLAGTLGGTVFNLRPPPMVCKTPPCSWTIKTLHSFTGGLDGENPSGDLIFDAAGNLDGTTSFGGAGAGCWSGCGVVYQLTPSGGDWRENILYRFQGGNDGGIPQGVISDNLGNLYGSAAWGTYGDGMVFQLEPARPNWTKNTIYSFHVESDGSKSFRRLGI